MKVVIRLFLEGGGETPVYTTEIDIPDDKLELLDEEETSAAIETNVRTWAQYHLMLDWEVKKDE